MEKTIDTVGVWFGPNGEATMTVVNYSDGDVRNYPGSFVMPDAEWKFMMSAKEKDVIHLSNGKTLRVWYN